MFGDKGEQVIADLAVDDEVGHPRTHPADAARDALRHKGIDKGPEIDGPLEKQRHRIRGFSVEQLPHCFIERGSPVLAAGDEPFPPGRQLREHCLHPFQDLYRPARFRPSHPLTIRYFGELLPDARQVSQEGVQLESGVKAGQGAGRQGIALLRGTSFMKIQLEIARMGPEIEGFRPSSHLQGHPEQGRLNLTDGAQSGYFHIKLCRNPCLMARSSLLMH